MRPLRLALLFALLALAAPTARAEDGVVANKDYNFEIRTPPDSIDWDIVAISEEEKGRGMRAHLVTEWADSDPPAEAHVIVTTMLMGKQIAKSGIESLGHRWKEAMEAHLENPRDRKEGMEKLGGIDCWTVDVTGNHATYGGIYRRHYWMAKNGKYLYLVYCDRSYDAVDDEDLDDELKEIIASFKFYEIVKIEADRKGVEAPPEVGGGEAGGGKEDRIDPERLKQEEIKDDFWKFECIKPEGMLRVPTEKLNDSEKANGCKVKFERRKDQSVCMIRVYVTSLKSGGRVYTIEQLADTRIKYFEKTFKKNMRQPPVIDKKWKLGKITKDGLSLKLVGRRATTEITHMYLADCKNDRQYQLEIYMTGGTAEKLWKNQVDSFLKSFQPLK